MSEADGLRGNCWCEAYTMSPGYPHRSTCKCVMSIDEPDEHTGPVCKKCGQKFYYDFIPERHDGSGMCWFCFEDKATPRELGRDAR